MAAEYDAIVVGGGHNGLICAAYLAKAGRSVLIVERRPVFGGAAVTEEPFPGFRFPALSHLVSLLRPQIIRDLDLPRYGLMLIPLQGSFTPFPDGRSLLRTADPERTRREIARFSPRDAEAYPEYERMMLQMSRFIKPVFDSPAPDPASFKPIEVLEMMRMGMRFFGLGKERMARFLKMMTMSAADLLGEWFESDALKAPLAAGGIKGTMLGVRSPGTAYVMLHHAVGEADGLSRPWGLPRGGTGRLSEACASAALRHGAKILTGSAVSRILVRDGQAEGVVLEDGEEIYGKVVVSGADPRRTFLSLVGREHLEPDFAARIERYKYRGSAGKVNLALDHAPRFSCRPEDGPHLRSEITIAPSLDYLERAYDEAKHGGFSRRPCLQIVIPSMTDPDAAPPGKHVMSVFAQYAPYHLADGPGTWPDKREAFGDAVVDTLEEYCPKIKDSILHRQVITPWDLEKDYGLTEGSIFHGELRLEQIGFLRPAAQWAHNRTPIEYLYLCGSGAHPGGGVMGAPGALAAREILESGVL